MVIDCCHDSNCSDCNNGNNGVDDLTPTIVEMIDDAVVAFMMMVMND